MKAAVISHFNAVPRYQDFPDPVAGKKETLVTVKASVLENFDKGTASGGHYSSTKQFPQFPAVAGTSGVGFTVDGSLVLFSSIRPPFGAFAEKTVAEVVIPVPDGIGPVKATALLPSVLTSLLSLRYSAKLQRDETVLINGATGVSGRIAVQVAKMLGAGKVVGTGRNPVSLEIVKKLGADEIISLEQTDGQLAAAFLAAGGEHGYDVVMDFIWGHPAEVLIGTFIPREAGFAKRNIRYLQIGAKAGLNITLPASALRTSGLHLMGAGKISDDVLMLELDQAWKWIKEDILYMEIEEVALADIAEAWQRDNPAGKRLVIIP